MTDINNKINEIESTIEEFSRLIRTVIRKTSPTIDQFDMNDIEQEIKIKLWKALTKSERKIHNLGSYIWRISYTTTSRIMKRLSRQRKLFTSQGEEDYGILESCENAGTNTPNGEYVKEETMNIIGESVNSLIETRRQVVKLYLSGMHLNEISELLDWSSGKTRNLLYRGLDDLRKKLQERGIGYESQKAGLKERISGE